MMEDKELMIQWNEDTSNIEQIQNEKIILQIFYNTLKHENRCCERS